MCTGRTPTKKPIASGDEFEALKFTSETQRGLHRQRQKYEFQVLFTTLAFYAAAASAVLANKGSLAGTKVVIVGTWIVFLVIAAISSAHLFRLHRGNRTNIDTARNAEVQIMSMLANSGLPVLPCYRDKGLVMRQRKVEVNWLCQAGMMVVFAAAGSLLVTSALLGKL